LGRAEGGSLRSKTCTRTHRRKGGVGFQSHVMGTGGETVKVFGMGHRGVRGKESLLKEIPTRRGKKLLRSAVPLKALGRGDVRKVFAR